jgi:hypothetical protein
MRRTYNNLGHIDFAENFWEKKCHTRFLLIIDYSFSQYFIFIYIEINNFVNITWLGCTCGAMVKIKSWNWLKSALEPCNFHEQETANLR